MGKALFLAPFLSEPMLLDAQSCELRGSVRDTRGGAVANASIELRNEDTSVRGATADRRGTFPFGRLTAYLSSYRAGSRLQDLYARWDSPGQATAGAPGAHAADELTATRVLTRWFAQCTLQPSAVDGWKDNGCARPATRHVRHAGP